MVTDGRRVLLASCMFLPYRPVNTRNLIERLSANAGVFDSLLAGVSDTQARWRPAPDKWSLLEVTCHLADEERDDFRKRLDLTLHDPGAAWPPIDPPAWVIERQYNSRDLDSALADFLQERQRSVGWLESLGAVDLSVAVDHPRLGNMAAGDLASAWAAHDLIHIRQMTRLHYEYLTVVAAPYSLAYAGAW
jgi:hypothetical protein